MRRLALLGGAEETRGGVWQSSAAEIWTLNWFYLYDWVPRIDRLFEMHPVWLYANTDREEWRKPREHWRYLHQALPYPVYMLEQLEEIPASVRYPIDDVTEYLFGERLAKAGKAQDFYSSSVDYMMALAIFEKWDVIELYGFEMGSLTEYRYQREGAAFFIGQAVARGIRVEIPERSVLLRARRYGYEGGQMIFRQDLERLHDKWTEKNRDALARLQHAEGQCGALEGMLLELVKAQNHSGARGADPVLVDLREQLQKAQENLRQAREEALITSGGLQLLEYQIRFVDLEEPEFKVINPLITIPTKRNG